LPRVKTWINISDVDISDTDNDDRETARRPARQSASLTPAMFEILIVLAGGERHGYSIMQEIEARGVRRNRIGPGTLYRSIQKLIDEGLIVQSVSRTRSADEERRRYYRITDRGRRTAKSEALRLSELVALAQSRNLLPKGRNI
jgi:DNA-binding PadR family transcriptional regulator